MKQIMITSNNIKYISSGNKDIQAFKKVTPILDNFLYEISFEIISISEFFLFSQYDCVSNFITEANYFKKEMNNIHKNPYICPWSVKTIIHRFKTSNIELVPSPSSHNLQPSSSSLLSRQLSMPSHIFATGIQLLLLHLK